MYNIKCEFAPESTREYPENLLNAVLDINLCRLLMYAVPSELQEKYFSDVASKIESVLPTLIEPEREVIIKLFKQGCTLEETMDYMGYKSRTVMGYVYSAIRKFKYAIQEIPRPEMPTLYQKYYSYMQSANKPIENVESAISLMKNAIESLSLKEKEVYTLAVEKNKSLTDISKFYGMSIFKANEIYSMAEENIIEFLMKKYLEAE